MSEFDKALTRKIKSLIPTQAFIAKVVSVNQVKFICTVIPLDSDVEVFKVRLKPTIDSTKTGIISIPTVDSFVIVGLLNNNINSAFVAWCSDVSAVYLNGDTHGGLVKVDDLKAQYDANIVAIKTAVLAGLAPVDAMMAILGLPAPTATQLFNSSAAAIANLNKVTLENTIVKHG